MTRDDRRAIAFFYRQTDEVLEVFSERREFHEFPRHVYTRHRTFVLYSILLLTDVRFRQ